MVCDELRVKERARKPLAEKFRIQRVSLDAALKPLATDVTSSGSRDPVRCALDIRSQRMAPIVNELHALRADRGLTCGVYDLAVGGNDRAKMIFHVMGEALGIAIGNLINIFNYPLYLISGGPIASWDLFAPVMMEQVALRSFTYRNSSTRIEKAILGSEAGLYGAAYLPFLTQHLD